jgi:hypothetical protein
MKAGLYKSQVIRSPRRLEILSWHPGLSPAQFFVPYSHIHLWCFKIKPQQWLQHCSTPTANTPTPKYVFSIYLLSHASPWMVGAHFFCRDFRAPFSFLVRFGWCILIYKNGTDILGGRERSDAEIFLIVCWCKGKLPWPKLRLSQWLPNSCGENFRSVALGKWRQTPAAGD